MFEIGIVICNSQIYHDRKNSNVKHFFFLTSIEDEWWNELLSFWDYSILINTLEKWKLKKKILVFSFSFSIHGG